MSRKKVILDYSQVDGGLNTVDDPLAIAKNQVQAGTVNAMLTKMGIQRLPGALGIKSTAVFSTLMEGLKFYLQEDGTELLMASGAGSVQEVTKTTGALAVRFALGGTGNACMKSFANAFWVCNGTGICKIENNVGYRVGIVAPVGATATAKAGGSLPDGVYKAALSYYRKVSSLIVLYSAPQTVANITLGGGNNTVTVSVPDSSDAQVGGAVLWMTDAAGSVYYSYGTLDGAGAYVFDVTSAAGKSVGLNMEVEALYNQLPANFIWLDFHDNRMFGVDPTTKHRVWYSNKMGTVYDLERFPAQGLQNNYIDYPFEVLGVISLGQHLYVNTKGGLIVQPYGDPTVKYEWVDKRYYFAFMNTVVTWGGKLIGLTNDGVRVFDGQAFSPDLTAKIKNIISGIYTVVAGHGPCGAYKKRTNRSEYHLSYIDTTIGTANNNQRLILNLDTLQYLGEGNIAASWELHDHGAEHIAVDSLGNMYCGQSVTGASTIYGESGTNADDRYFYNKAGTFLTAQTSKALKVFTHTEFPAMNARCRFQVLRCAAKLTTPITIKITAGGKYGISGTRTIGDGAGIARFGTAVFGVDRFASEGFQQFKRGLQQNLNGYSGWVYLEQAGNDIGLQILKTSVDVEPAQGRMT
ncbi:conserved hypothetical protein [Gammaproteobacteria bacterium]